MTNVLSVRVASFSNRALPRYAFTCRTTPSLDLSRTSYAMATCSNCSNKFDPRDRRCPRCGAEDSFTRTNNFVPKKSEDESFEDRDIDGIEDGSNLSVAISWYEEGFFSIEEAAEKVGASVDDLISVFKELDVELRPPHSEDSRGDVE